MFCYIRELLVVWTGRDDLYSSVLRSSISVPSYIHQTNTPTCRCCNKHRRRISVLCYTYKSITYTLSERTLLCSNMLKFFEFRKLKTLWQREKHRSFIIFCQNQNNTKVINKYQTCLAVEFHHVMCGADGSEILRTPANSRIFDSKDWTKNLTR